MSGRRQLADQGGFTLIEVLVAILLLSGGLLGTLTMFNSAQRASAGNVRNQSAQALAQAYVERLANVKTAAQWTALALTANPVGENLGSSPTNPDTPAAYLRSTAAGAACAVAASCGFYAIVKNPHNTGSGVPTGTTATGATVTVTSPETILTGGSIVNKPTSLPSGVSAIYQYVTRASDVTTTVNGTTFYGKRVIVAVLLTNNASNTVEKPVWASTVVTDPGVTAP